MIANSVRETLYGELERNHPVRRATTARFSGGAAECRFSVADAADLPVQWQQQVLALKESVLTELLFQIHTLFAFPEPDAQIQSATRQALESLYRLEHACGNGGIYDVQGFALFLFRRHWHAPRVREGSLPDKASALLTGLDHVQQASFFHKVRQEIATWTKWFLLVERYHRLDAIESEARLDRYRTLRNQPRNSLIRHFDDLLIWLEQALLHAPDGDVSRLSREVSQEIEAMLSPDLFPGLPLQPVLYILLRCHQYCLSETMELREQKRVEKSFATRQLDSLLDLMRVVMTLTVAEHRLPQMGAILDRLQEEGFNIEHQGFRDPYEAQLVPLADTERFEMARLPLFLSLEELSGRFPEDLEKSRQMLRGWHRGIINEILNDYQAYRLALAQPLPRAQLVQRLVRFASSWILARHPWPVSKCPENMEEVVRGLIPENVLRFLVRPRKGYEIRSRRELARLIEGESRRQWEALERIASRRRIQGYHYYTVFTRYLVFQHLQQRWGTDPVSGEQSADVDVLDIQDIADPEWVAEISRKWSIDSKQAYPHSLEALREYLRNVASPDVIIPQLGEGFVASENERKQAYDTILDQATPLFYRLLVAYGRNQAQLPRLSGTLADVFQLVNLLAPPFAALAQAAYEGLRQDFAHAGGPLYRKQLRLYLVNRSEWEAYLAWETHRHIGENSGDFLEGGDLDLLLSGLERAAQNVDLPPRELLSETVQSALLAFLTPAEGALQISDADVQDLMLFLPQIDCGACGQPNCREFARSLLAGRMEPRACVQMTSNGLPLLIERLERLTQQGDGKSSPVSLLDLLTDRRAWQNSSERLVFQNVLSPLTQKMRRLFLEHLKGIWERLSPKPQIFKCPDVEIFYQELYRYLGYEAAERLLEEEKEFLIAHGDLRQQAEWKVFKKRQDWLVLASRKRQGRPLLRAEDPAWLAEEGYRNGFFLHQLSSRDRSLVLRRRLDHYQDGFSHWWNEDLLTMNLPDYSIRDWEDFAKVVHNAYWHQETPLPIKEVLNMLHGMAPQHGAPAPGGDLEDILTAYLNHFMDQEMVRITRQREKMRVFREGYVIADMKDLRDLVQALVGEKEAADSLTDSGAPGGDSEGMPLSPGAAAGRAMSPEDRQALDFEDLWERFQSGRFNFSPAFFCRWEDLNPSELEALKMEMAGSRTVISQTESAPFMVASWNEALPKRVALMRALLLNCVRERNREQAECQWLEKTLQEKPRGRPPLGSVKLLIRRRFQQGGERRRVESELQGILEAHSALRAGLLEDVFYQVIVKRQVEFFRTATEPLLSIVKESEETDGFLNALPEFKSLLDMLLRRHQSVDRERLLHYLFLLAKMEGNLDTLTALLREIRETSDIIEAAWLRFTEERIVEGPAPKSLPGTLLGIPLLVSRLKDKEPVNLGLREGIGRREKRNVAAAVAELLNFIRYHVLRRAEDHGAVDDVLKDMTTAGYDLSGIEEEALQTAIGKEWHKREQLARQKIRIYTTVTARRLAAQHSELQEAEREFYKIRLDLLKDGDGEPGPHHETASRRGVALGQIKEELYRELSDLLESQRIVTFQKRIRQIVEQLDRKLEEIHVAWSLGEINRRTVFYLLRQYQKIDRDPSWEDFERFLTDHWFHPLLELRSSRRPDREERIRDLDEGFRAVLGTSLLELEREVTAAARHDLDRWTQDQLLQIASGKLESAL